MATLTIVGLGPGAADAMTLGAWKTLMNANQLILRTEHHPCVTEIRQALPPTCTLQTCDDLYEHHADFRDVYAAIVARVLDAAARQDTVYAVPGHPWVGEATTPELMRATNERGITVQVIDGLSFVAPAFGQVQVDLMDGSQVCDAMLLARQHYPQVETTLPLLVGQVYARWLASDLKLVLLAAYPPEHEVLLIRGAASSQAAVLRRPLAELDHHDTFDHLTSLYVPPLPEYSDFSALQELVAHLRAPEGCPWDREQTLASLRKDLLEEVSEVIEAIDADEAGEDASENIAEELGDLYLVATMLVQIATEEGRFQMAEVMNGVVTKLIRRHPHVFGDVAVTGVDHVLANWDAIKVQEKASIGIQPGPLDGVPAALPALAKARKLQSKAAKAGLLDRSALANRTPALATLLGEAPDAERLGELLWELVAVSHQHGLDAEDALRTYAVAFRMRAVRDE